MINSSLRSNDISENNQLISQNELITSIINANILGLTVHSDPIISVKMRIY
jgi:hypothetical protein